MVDEIIFNAALRVLQGSDPGLEWANVELPPDSAEELRAVQDTGCLRADEIEISIYPPLHEVEACFKQYEAPGLFLIEMTQDCNLRCSYCCYSGDSKFRRRRSTESASFSHLQKAVDWYFNNRDSSRVFHIGFYGGEPLLHFDNLIGIMDYARAKSANPDLLNFSLTTNGTLLTADRAGDLIDRKAMITVSLDGPREVHDWYRVDVKGDGSFSHVMDNLKAIWNRMGEAAYSNIRFLSTLDPRSYWSDMAAWETLVESQPFLSGFSKRVNKASITEGNEPRLNRRTSTNETDKMMGILRKYVKYVESGETVRSHLGRWVFDNSLRKIHERSCYPLQGHVWSKGACIPGNQRLFVSLSGKFYPCEKVDERFEIGSLDEGVDADKVYRISEMWNRVVEKACKGCWAIRFCENCLASISDVPDSESVRLLQDGCTSIQSVVARNLVLYCAVMERNKQSSKTFSEKAFAQ